MIRDGDRGARGSCQEDVQLPGGGGVCWGVGVREERHERWSQRGRVGGGD